MVTVGIWRVYMTAVTLDPAHLPMYMMVGISREYVLAVASHSLDCCHVRLDCHLPPPPSGGPQVCRPRNRRGVASRLRNSKVRGAVGVVTGLSSAADARPTFPLSPLVFPFFVDMEIA